MISRDFNTVHTKNFAVIPFNYTPINNKYLVSNMLGSWDFLNKDELQTLNSFRCEKGTLLFNRLHNSGIIMDEGNYEEVLSGYVKLNGHLFGDTGLHIAVITTRCNLNCRYCQTKLSKKNDMSLGVAAKVLDYLFSVRSRMVTLEFQGGEPLLNWEVFSFLVENARKLNRRIGKDLRLALVTNGTLLDEQKNKFLSDFDVSVCISLDGPEYVHDKNRVYANGKGTYKQIIKNIKKFKKSSAKYVGLIPTITKHSFRHHKEIIDEYMKLNQSTIALRPVNSIGNACNNWYCLGYTAEEFIDFYKRSMDYILELNRLGTAIKERTAVVMLKKILGKTDPGFVDLMSPCGAGRGQIVYMPDGSCYPCDESRMLDEEMFKLGNIKEDKYEELMKKENLLHLLEASLISCWDYASAFSQWLGTCPIINYASQKNIVPKIWCSSLHKIYNAQFKYLFEKMEEDNKNISIFKKWIMKKEEKNGQDKA